jgi:hypothetical protein
MWQYLQACQQLAVQVRTAPAMMKQESSLTELRGASWRLLVMWTRGWLVMIKSVLAYLIAGLFLAPLGLVWAIAGRTAEPGSWALLLCLAGILFYVPLVVYVAASWVGFCPYVGAADDELSSYRSPDAETDTRGT